MEVVYGVEHCELSDQSQDDLNELFTTIESIATIIDRDEQLLIVKTEHEYKMLQNFFEQKAFLEECLLLFQLDSDSIHMLNTDYGFTADSGHSYLYKELTFPFQVSLNTEQEQMAMLQMQEHIIAEEEGGSPIYYADRQQQELILRIASAYQVSFTLL
ncbi:hypothetical protein [Alkalihalobacillus sp. AL-G]|uniref:hypothetical protein n=1 Tax=Alkalihalobacillus sp. AL-G TaxID=2926399 RepID=UPI00272C44A0|nr:hypothetical protein [Alkalihalobacillus sp. AL-G]WLD92056.1 hypothetical protein MOJ78_13570 [Alkalihalobacillus sp. AL-G]